MRGWKLRGCMVRLCECNAANVRWRLHLVYVNAVHSAGVTSAFLGDNSCTVRMSQSEIGGWCDDSFINKLFLPHNIWWKKKQRKKKEQSWRLLCFDTSNWLCITAAYQPFNHSCNLKWDMKNLNSLHESSFYLSSLARLNRNHSLCIYRMVPCVEYNACPPCWDRKL